MSVTDATSPSVKAKKRFDIAIGFAVCGVLFSLLIFLFMFKQERDAAIQRFHVQAAQDSALFQQTLTQNLYSLDSLQAYFYMSEGINEDEFRIAAKRIASRSKAVNAVAWLPTENESLTDSEVTSRGTITISAVEGDLLLSSPTLIKLLEEVSILETTQAFSEAVIIDGAPYLLVSSTDDLNGKGRLAVLIDLHTVVKSSLLNTLDSDIAVDLSVNKAVSTVEGEAKVFTVEKQDLAADSAVAHVVNIVPSKTLTLNFSATETYLSDKMSYTSALFLLTGLLLSFLMASYLRRIGQHLHTLKSEQEALAGQVNEISCNDPLTGLVNRLHFDEALEIECGRAVRDFSPLTMILLRIDDFQPYSERYGIDAADDLLQQISGTLKSCVGRPGDMIARLDNNLFGFILPSTNELVVQLAERCCNTVRELGLPNESLSTEGKVAISAGVATLQPSSLLTAGRLFDVANEQLTIAMNEGGDRYVAFAENSVEPSVTYSV